MKRSILAAALVLGTLAAVPSASAAPVVGGHAAVKSGPDANLAEPVRYRSRGFRVYRSYGYRGFYGHRGFHRGFGFRRNPFISLR